MTTTTTARPFARYRGCDCADPECTLPTGRCYLCGTPTEKANEWTEDRIEYTVGACCARKVLRAYREECRASIEPAWAPFNGDGRTLFEIQCVDVVDVFDGDGGAARYVAHRLGIEPAYPDGF